jgi:non-ribosomal peptide synthase protein (TIGR01720 family)
MVEHSSLVNLATWHQRAYDVREEDRATQLAGLAFDASIWEVWPYLISGASIHIPDDDTVADPSALMAWLVAQEITLSFLPTPLAEVALGQQWPSGIRLRALLTGGDKLHKRPSPDLPFVLINHYGPTENTVVTTCATVPAQDETFAAPPIGRPIDNTQAYVLDRNLLPVPMGVPGELLIGGDSLALGYLKQPGLTAERFLPNPFSAAPGARMYSTGDIVRHLPDGNLEFLGRKDHQVKIRGFRIELGDIEAALGHHKAVREAVVVAREDLPGEKRLVGYVVAHRETPVTATELRTYLKERLPDYMAPASFVMLDSLPLTPNGKIDRRALPRTDHERPEQQKSFVAPRSAAEQTLAEIWTQVLHVDRVGVEDNFFELGGDSILGVQLIARANQAGLRLTPRQLFQHQTVAELAAVAGTAVAVESQQGPVTGRLPLTPIQAWFFEQDYPEPHHFNQAILLEVRRHVDADSLREVVRQILLHHDSLRLRFSRSDSGWTQQIAPPGDDAPFTRVELTHLSNQERAEVIESYCSSVQASLNLSDGPLVRVALIETGPGKPGRLLMAIHNLAVDGVSWRILLSDIQSAYEQLERGEPIRLPAKTTSYKAWAERLAEYAQSRKLRDEAGYWLSDSRMRAPRMAIDFAGGENTEASAREVKVSLSAEETWKLLHEALEAYHTEINDVLLAALALAYDGWAGARSLLVDIEGHGREEIVEGVDLSRTVGWFTTIFPVRLEIEGATSHGEVLRAVKQQLRQIPDRGIGFGLLRYLSKEPEIVKKLRDLPRAQMNFNYLGQFDQALSESALFKIATESTGLLRSPKEARPYLIEVNAIVVEGRLQLIWIYSENLHRRETVERFAQLFIDELRSLIENSGRAQEKAYTASDFPLASLDELELSKLFNKLDEIDSPDPGE